MRSWLTFLSLVLCAAGVLAEETPIAKTGAAIRQADAAWRLAQSDAGTASARDRAEASLREALAPLEAQNAKRAAEFATAAARPLPEKAMARLQASRAAYAATYERLAAILRQLLADPKPESLEALRPALLAEALQILDRIEASARQKPISQTLPVNSPQQQPPPIGVPSGTITTVPVGAIPAILQKASDALPGVAEVYETVRNGTQPEFYFGVMKGASETYRENSGNDADTASVLVQMIRAKGIPARYVRGVAELKAPAFMAMTGAGTIEQAVRVFERAGIPHEVVLGAGSVASVKFERVWAEAYVPYANYRGSMLDEQGKAWIPLDAGFKSLEPPRGTDPATLGFDASAAFEEYLSANQTETPMQFIKRQATGLAGASGQSYSSLLNSRGFGGQVSGLLPNSLPYRVVAVTERSYDLPDSLNHTIHIVGTMNGETILDYTTRTSEVVGKRFTLGYSPATEEEAELVTAYGGLLRTPPYLIEVKPILSIGGVSVYAGMPAPMGVVYNLRMDIMTPGGTTTIENRVQTGNLMGIALGGAVQASQIEDDASAAQILSSLALRYFDSWNASDNELANLLHVIPVRPTVSVCLVGSSIEVEYADGDGLLPVGWEWKGLFIDADLRATSPVGVRDREAEQRFIQLSGLEGSVLENRVFEEAYQIESVSTAKVLGMAASQGIPILEITSGNLDAIETLPFDAEVKGEVLDAAQRGRLVTIPSTPVTYLAWTGVGYLIQDDENQAAAYQLQGGHSGGVTAPSVLTIPAAFSDKFKDPTGEPVAGDPDKIVGSIKIVPSTNFQIGTVDQVSKKPLSVFVTDGNGFPLAGAVVTFQVIGGGGTLSNILGIPAAGTVSVISDDRGYASTHLHYGTRTDLIPRYLAPSTGEEHSTQVGLNLITATAGLARLDEPFSLFGLPDERRPAPGQPPKANVVLKAAQGGGWLSNLRVAGRLDIAVQDQFGNPISNVPIEVTSRVAEAGVPPGIRPPIADFGRVLNQTDYARCAALTPTVFWGECAGEAVTLPIKSSNLGVFAFVAMGASTASYYTFDIGTEETPNILWASYPTVGTFCTEGDCNLLKTPISYTSSGARGIWRNANGDEVEAYAPGAVATMTFFTDAVREKDRVRKDTQTGKYYVEGINEWVRERLEGSTVTLTSRTPGTLAQGTATPVAGKPGEYEASVTMASTPQKNTVDYEVRAIGPRPRAALDGEVDLQFVDTSDTANMKLKPEGWWPDPGRAGIGKSSFSLWGVTSTIHDVFPRAVFLRKTNDPRNVIGRYPAAHDSRVSYSIQPPEYVQLVDPTQVLFEVAPYGAPQDRVLSAAGTAGESAGIFTIPKDTAMVENEYGLQVSLLNVRANGGTIQSSRLKMVAGVVELITDANNDTIVDAQDEEQTNTDANRTFQFWEGDGTKHDEDSLVDYATIRVRVSPLLAGVTTTPWIGLRLFNGAWEMMTKDRVIDPGGNECEQEGKQHLCDGPTADTQSRPGLVPEADGTIMLGWDAFGSLPGSARVTRDFLVRCNKRANGQRACPFPTLDLVNADRVITAQRKVDFQPFDRLVSLMNLRRHPTLFDPANPNEDHFRLLPISLVGSEGPNVPPDARSITLLAHGYNVSSTEFRDVSFPKVVKRLYWAGHPILREQDKSHVVGIEWPANIPGPTGPFSARPELYLPEDEFNALLGGVPLAEFIQGLRVPVSGRRLNIFGHSLGNMLVNSALTLLPTAPSGAPPIVLVMNDAAVPMDAFEETYNPFVLAASDSPNAAAVTGLINHAQRLGYPAVANARADDIWREELSKIKADLSRPGCLSVPPYVTPERRLSCAPFLQSEPPVYEAYDDCTCASSSAYFRGTIPLNQVLGVLPAAFAADDPNGDRGESLFMRRWEKYRRQNDTLGSAWTGLFGPTAMAGRNIVRYNTYNTEDAILRIDRGPVSFQFLHGWYIGQLLAKPWGDLNAKLLSLPTEQNGTDTRFEQKWWTLSFEDRSGTWSTTLAGVEYQRLVWGHQFQWGAAFNPVEQIERTRGWAERALWFPALAPPAGAVAIPGLVGSLPSEINLPKLGRNIDFTSLGPGEFPLPFPSQFLDSHSYIHSTPLPKVWEGFRTFAKLFSTNGQ